MFSLYNISSVSIFHIFKNFLAMPRGMWDLSSPSKDQICALCTGNVES